MSEKIEVYHLECKVYLLKTIGLINMQKEIAHLIDIALCKTEQMTEFHIARKFKNYCFSGFLPIESNGLYKEGKVYSFSIRCIGKEKAEYLCKQIPHAETNCLKGIVCSYKLIPQIYIDKLYSMTSVVVETGNGYWREKIKLEEYERLLFENCVKKYNNITGRKVDEDFKLYDGITFLNRKPIRTNYKNISLLGDKLELVINSDERAQDIAYMLLGTALGNRGARGYGYVNYKTQ